MNYFMCILFIGGFFLVFFFVFYFYLLNLSSVVSIPPLVFSEVKGFEILFFFFFFLLVS